jgi:hypothetical protein
MRLERTTSFGSLLLSSTLLALGACGDDDGTASGTAESTGGSADTTAAPMTTEESVDTTAGPGGDTTTDNPTTGVDTTDGPDDTTTGPPPGGQRSFRFNSIALTDPSGGFPSACNNPDQVNGLLAPALTSDMDGNGFLDMAFVLNFPELDQGDGAMGDIEFANAQCDVPDGATCALLEGSPLYPSTYSVMLAGTCLEPDQANITPGSPEPPGSTTGPCFVTGAVDAVVMTSSVSIPLADAMIAARFVGEPAGNLVEGTIIGFLSQADAQATVVEVPVLGPTPLGDLLCDEHLDDGGWWMHMSFTGITTDWTG